MINKYKKWIPGLNSSYQSQSTCLLYNWRSLFKYGLTHIHSWMEHFKYKIESIDIIFIRCLQGLSHAPCPFLLSTCSSPRTHREDYHIKFPILIIQASTNSPISTIMNLWLKHLQWWQLGVHTDTCFFLLILCQKCCLFT